MQENDNKRRLPRHVDGRIMVGPFYIINFLKLLPIELLLFFIVKNTINGAFNVAILSMLILSIPAMMFAEFNRYETGFDILRDTILGYIEGDQIIERSLIYEPSIERIIFNKKVQEIKSRVKTGHSS